VNDDDLTVDDTPQEVLGEIRTRLRTVGAACVDKAIAVLDWLVGYRR
jgi:hypothetical protein